jgi:hypothetical protein
MSEIGHRSGKIRAGEYKFGQYRIVRQPSDYWHVYIYYGSDHERMVHQANTLSDAQYWCRRN